MTQVMATVQTPGLPVEYLTTISVSAAFDVMTDQAAFRNQNRFESIYSTMIIVNQVIHGRNKVSDADLAKYYQMTLKAAVEELAGYQAATRLAAPNRFALPGMRPRIQRAHPRRRGRL